MRTIDGHFTIINEPGTARTLSAHLLDLCESVRDPEHIIITETILEYGASRAQRILLRSIDHSIDKINAQIESIDVPNEKVTYVRIEKAQVRVLEATQRAERTSSKKNWRKLDKAQKVLAKELDREEFHSYTAYADFVNAQGIGGDQRRELFVARDELVAKKKMIDTAQMSLTTLTPAQIITVLADVLSRCPKTPIGPLPIVFDDALRNLDVSTKLRALEVLKAHATNYATWYVTDDPVVLSWAGFKTTERDVPTAHSVYDVDIDVA